jgi:hypothetical protein
MSERSGWHRPALKQVRRAAPVKPGPGHQSLNPALSNHHIAQRDDGLFEILPAGCGPFPTRNFAQAVWLRQTRHQHMWLEQ